MTLGRLMTLKKAGRIRLPRRRWAMASTSICGKRCLVWEQHTSGDKKVEEDAQKATGKELEEIKRVGEKTGPKRLRYSIVLEP
jgi:hypothetical protein